MSESPRTSAGRPTTPKALGDALENAVIAIESTILRASPHNENDTLRILPRKVLVVEGVRHEIDIWVEVTLAKGYRPIFIFECKNWSTPVGKNEIIVFSEKVRAAQAQNGFFVARSFTKDAEAQALKDPRVTLLSVAEHDPLLSVLPFAFDYLLRDRSKMRSEALFAVRGKAGESGGGPIDSGAEISVAGVAKTLNEFCQPYIDMACDDRMLHFNSWNESTGVHDLEAERVVEFAEGEVSTGGRSISALRLHVQFQVEVVRPSILSHFEVSGRGRVLVLEPVMLGGTTLQAMFSAVPE